MTAELVSGSRAGRPGRSPRIRNEALYQAACDAADADPDERRAVCELDACALFTGMTVWYWDEFRQVKKIDRPMTPEITIYFVAPAGVNVFWFTRRTDPVYALVYASVTTC